MFVHFWWKAICWSLQGLLSWQGHIPSSKCIYTVQTPGRGTIFPSATSEITMPLCVDSWARAVFFLGVGACYNSLVRTNVMHLQKLRVWATLTVCKEPAPFSTPSILWSERFLSEPDAALSQPLSFSFPFFSSQKGFPLLHSMAAFLSPISLPHTLHLPHCFFQL